MAKIASQLTELIGNTPLLELTNYEKELGLNITDEQIEEMKSHADDINFEVAKEREKVVRHDVMSHVYAYGVQCPNCLLYTSPSPRDS